MRRSIYVVLSIEQVIHTVEENDNMGFCIACGDEAFSAESDARRHTCESCDQLNVCGAEELLMMMAWNGDYD